MNQPHPDDRWRFELPCAFFDGENSFLSELQGWQKTIKNDIVISPEYYWTRKSIGSARPEERWAIERVFYHEKTNIYVMTFEILDQGISYMIWWIKGDTGRKYGSAIKASGSWRVAQEDEDLLKDFESEEKDGAMIVARVCLKIYSKTDGRVLERVVISR